MKKPDFKTYFSAVKNNPGKIFGVVYIYILLTGLILGMYYVNNLGTVSRQSVPPSMPAADEKSDLKVVEAKVIPPVDLSSVQNPPQEMLDKGKQLYATACSSCHGEDGSGNGPAGISLNPKPRNFTIKEGWKNGPSLSGIYKTLEEGIPGTPMISYNYMPPDERIAIANYMRSIFIPAPAVVTQEEVTTLDQTYNLSRGTEVSAQIPVAEAMNLYLTENRSRTDKLIGLMREISASDSQGSMIFKRITSDRGKAVTSLFSNNEWMQDKNKFTALVNTSVNRNGFNSQIFSLTEKEWDVLYSYMASIF